MWIKPSAIGVTLLIWVCGIITAHTQDPAFHFKEVASVSAALGQGDVIVTGTASDQAGFIWLSTIDGLYRFDGVSLEPYAPELTEQILPYLLEYNRMACDPDGDLWIVSTERGIVELRNESKQLQEISIPAEAGETVRYGAVYFTNDNQVWITTSDTRLHRYDQGTGDVTTFELPHPQNQGEDLSFGSIIADPADPEVLWIGSKYGLTAFHMVDTTSTFYPLSAPYQYYYGEWPVPLEAFNGYILSGAPSDIGIDAFNMRERLWSARMVYPQGESILEHAQVITLSTVSENLVIVGLFSGQRLGLVSIDATGQLDYKIEPYAPESGTLNHTLAVTKSQNGALHAVTIAGITRIILPDERFRFFRLTPRGESRNNWQRSFLQLEDPGRFLLGTIRGDGLFVIDWEEQTKQFIPYKSEIGFFNFDVSMWALAMDSESQCWIGSDQGLLRADLDQQQIWQPEFVGGTELAAEIHFLDYRDPFLFAGSSRPALLTFDQENGSLREIGQVGYVHDIEEVDGQLWVATDRGLHAFEWPSLTPTTVPFNTSEEITDLQIVGDSVWYATREHGLWCAAYTGGEWSIRQYLNPAVYRSNFLHKIIYRPKHDQLWLNTHYGYSCFDLRSHRFVNYSLDDGIGFARKNKSIFAELYDGAIICGANRMFQYFYPDSLAQSTPPPKAYIKEITSNGKPVSLDSEDHVILPAGTKNISLTAGGLNMNLNAVNYYSFRFGGQNVDWGPWTPNASVQYENLKGGQYELAFRVANKLYKSEGVKSVTIDIEKKLTEMLAFKLGVVLLIVLFSVSAFYYRLRQQKREAEMAAEFQAQIKELQINSLRLQMNPHFVFNSINSINYYIIQNEKDKASAYLAKFSRLIRQILENSKQDFISLHQELDAIKLYLDMEKIRFEEQFDFEIDIEPGVNLSSIRIPPLIIQPYVENAIWHGLMHKEGHGEVVVRIRSKDGFVQCVIEDDGIGRAAAAAVSTGKGMRKQSLGTRITQERLDYIEEMHGVQTNVMVEDLTHMDGSSAGTRVTVNLPKEKPVLT